MKTKSNFLVLTISILVFQVVAAIVYFAFNENYFITLFSVSIVFALIVLSRKSLKNKKQGLD